ncbi:LuxR family transcriptional regulator [Saccharopolyspora rosea]|uniref:AAA family ATPase n=2 Tax=Saccharopolyspora rosea TaxID=524884 RepID=A0ABW3FLL9_9PSEU
MIQRPARTSTTLPENTPARTPRTGGSALRTTRSARSHGRDEAVSRILDVCASRPGVPLVVVTGPSGSGRSSVLAQVGEKLAEQGICSADVPLSRGRCGLADVVARFADALGAPAPRDEAALHRMLAALGRRAGRFVVFLDDAHRIAPDALVSLAALARTLSGSGVTVVCSFRTPTAHPSAELAALRAAGLVHEERLRPLSRYAVEQMLVDLLRAKPAPGLATALRDSSRGNPAVVAAAVEGWQRAGLLRTVDRHAHLVEQHAPRLPATHRVFAAIRELGAEHWDVAKALAVLHPLHGPVPGLIADTVGVSEQDVHESLRALHAVGVVVPGPRPDSWRFRVPMLAELLTTCLGPYERHRSAQLAVLSLWAGTASCPDPGYLPRRLLDAGRLAPPEAAVELLDRHAVECARDGDLADRWRRAAAKLIADPTRRAAALHRHAVACARHRCFAPAAETADLALATCPEQLGEDALHELQILYVIGLASSADSSRLHDFAQVGWRSMPGGEDARLVSRAAALCLLGRWRDAHDQLTGERERWAHGGTAATGAALIRLANAVLGTTAPAEVTAAAPDESTDLVRLLVRTLTLGGWLGRGRDDVDEPVRASFAGQWDRALDLARSEIATASARGLGPAQTGTFRELATILTARGQLARARAVIEDGRSRRLLLPHLLHAPAAELERTLGAHERSLELLDEGLALAAESGVVAGTDELWLRKAEAELRRGHRPVALRCAAQVERVADELGTPGARRNRLLARVLVHRDPTAAVEVVELATKRGRPYELAETLAVVGESGLGDQKALRAAYEMFGELDALIPRARLRRLMRARKVAVPGRSETVAENERLLAVLIAAGLTNAQLATVLGSSEKSVEGRLTRFFNRTGYRSRAELATAALRGFLD